MTAQRLLDRFDGVRQTGPGRWLVKGKCHDDGRASLSIRELDDGRVLVHCFAGCSANDVLTSVGLELCDLFPPRDRVDHRTRGGRAPHFGSDVVRALQSEILLVVFMAADLAEGKPLDEVLRQRALLAASRILGALDAAVPTKDRRAELRAALRVAVRNLHDERVAT